MACVIISRTPLSNKLASFISVPLIILAISNTPSTVLSNYSSRGSPLILGDIDVRSDLNNDRDNLMNLMDRATFLYPERKSLLDLKLR